MSVSRTCYLVFGWKLPGELYAPDGTEINVYEDEFLPYIEGHKGCKETIVFDGMCGEYTVFGTYLGSLYGDTDDFKEIELANLDEAHLRAKFYEVFKFNAPTEQAKVLFFNHFS